MKKRTLRRILAVFLSVAVLLPTIPTARSAASYTKDALFSRFPQYLANAESQRRANELMQSGVDILEATTSSDQKYAMLFTYIRDSVNITANVALQQPDSDLKKYRMELAQEVLAREMVKDGGLVCAENETLQMIQSASSALDVYEGAVTAVEIAEKLEFGTLYLTEPQVVSIFETIQEVGKVEQNVLVSGAYMAKTFQVALTVIALYELEMQALETLLDYTDPNSDLGIGLQLLHDVRSSNPAYYVGVTWLNTVGLDFVIQAVSETVKLFQQPNLPAAYIALIKACAVFFIEVLYVGPTMDEIILSYLAYANVNSAQVALSKCRLEMMQQGYATAEQQRDYCTLYNLWLCAIEEFLERTAELTTVSEYALRGRALSDMQTLEEGYYLSYDIHLELCTQQLNKDIASGKLGENGELPEVGANINAESIADRLKAIQERYIPNAGIAYSERYGYSYGSAGFARLVFNLLFGVDMPVCTQDSRRFQLYGTENVSEIGLLTPANYDASNVKNLLQQALPGDILIGYGGSRVHYMVVVGSDETGLTVYDCDSPYAGEYEKNLIRQYTISYLDIFSAFGTSDVDGLVPGLALYRCSTRDRVSEGGAEIRYDDSVNFVIEDGVLIAYNGWQSHVVIPEGVTKVGANAFAKNPTSGAIERVTCPSTLTEIDYYGFYGLSNLMRIDLPRGLESIGYSAFMSCARLTTIALPDSVTRVGEFAFLSCTDLVAVKLSDGMTNLSRGMFMKCTALTGVVLPRNLQSMEGGVFAGCTALGHIDIPGTLTTVTYADYNGGPFNGCSALRSFTLGAGMTTIPKGLFSYTGLEEVTIPAHITKLDYGAFQGCAGLKELDLGSVQTIGQYAFSDCASLVELVVPETVTALESIAFAGCTALKEVSLPDALTTIGSGAFRTCTSLVSVELPDGLQRLEWGAFGNCTALEHIDIPGSLITVDYTSYDSGPFYGCSALRSFTLGKAMTTIPRGLFSYTGLKTVAVPDHITGLDYGAFQGCAGLKELDLGSVQTIGQYAFGGCTALDEVIVPATVTAVESIAFAGCTALERVSFYGSAVEIDRTAFQSCPILTVCGWSGSAVESYAETNGIPFEPLGTFENPAEAAPGDTVRIQQLQYTPPAANEDSGVSVTVANLGGERQTVTAIAACYSNGQLVALDTAEVVFDGEKIARVILRPDHDAIPDTVSIFITGEGSVPLCGHFPVTMG